MTTKAIDKNLYSASYLMPQRGQKRSTGGAISRLNTEENIQENMKLLDLCQMYWSSLSDFRTRRQRSRKYERGDQWFEEAVDEDGKLTTEEDIILSQNRLPLKQNVIRQLVKNLLGQYRSNPVKSVVNSRTREDATLSEMMTNALQAAKDLNESKELDAQQFHEHLLSGMVVGKVGFSYWKELDRNDLLLENVNVNRTFFNTEILDIRTRDLNLAGEIIDTDYDILVSTFARSKADEEWIKEEYQVQRGYNTVRQDALSAKAVDATNFYYANEGKCRMFEVWFLKSEWRLWVHDYATGTYKFYPLKDEPQLKAEMENRIVQGAVSGIPTEEVVGMEIEKRYEQFWFVKYLTPNGKCLFEGETPYFHQSHPYVFGFYPLLDGEVWGIHEDVIDQQRYINRNMSMLDYLIGTSIKDTLLIEESTVPENMKPEDFADAYTKVGGVIVYKGKVGIPEPSVISSNSRSIGASEMIAMQMQLANQLTGVNQAMQGQTATSGTPASRYAMEAQNSSLNNRDVIESYASWIKRRDNKALQTILQFYTEKIYLGVSGHAYSEEAKYYDPEAVKDVAFFANISSSADTPVYRQMIDDTLMQLLDKQVIDGEIFLKNSSLPFADKILDDLNKKREELMSQAQAAGVDPNNPMASLPLEMQKGLQQPQAGPKVFA